MKQKLLQTLINFEEEAYAHYYNSGASLETNRDCDEVYLNYLIRTYPKEEQNIYNVLSHLQQEQQS